MLRWKVGNGVLSRKAPPHQCQPPASMPRTSFWDWLTGARGFQQGDEWQCSHCNQKWIFDFPGTTNGYSSIQWLKDSSDEKVK